VEVVNTFNLMFEASFGTTLTMFWYSFGDVTKLN